jgi:hypothetical protein
MVEINEKYQDFKCLENKLGILNLNSRHKCLWHYHRKSILPGEVAVKSAAKLSFKYVVSGILGLSKFLCSLTKPGDVYYRLDRANLASYSKATIRQIIIKEKVESGDSNVQSSAYIIRSLLRLIAIPSALQLYLSTRLRLRDPDILSKIKISSAINAEGDRFFCILLVLLKSLFMSRASDKIYFSAAVVPDAHLYVFSKYFIEVSHGVIHYGHPSLFNLNRLDTQFIVPDEHSMYLCLQNTHNGNFRIDRDFYKRFFSMSEQGPKVFISQPGEIFETIALRFLAKFPEWRVRPHPRSSKAYSQSIHDRITFDSDVSALSSVSSTMLNDAIYENIEIFIIRSINSADNISFQSSFQGLTLPSEIKYIYV